MKAFRLIICTLIITGISLTCKADTIFFKDGKTVETRQAWEEGNMIKCYRFGGIVSYPKDSVLRIEKEDSTENDNGETGDPKNQRRAITIGGSIACPTWQFTRKMDDIFVREDYAKFQSNILSGKCVVLGEGDRVEVISGPKGSGGYVEINYKGRILWVYALGLEF